MSVTVDAHGHRHASVPVEVLEDWMALLGRLEEWLVGIVPILHDEDWLDFWGGRTLASVVDELGNSVMLMRACCEGRL